MNRTELPIAAPCTQDWTTMTLAERGRFCGQCRKVVHELARLTEGEARALLASPSTDGLCVRYVHDATGEIVFRPDVVPVSRLARVRRVAALAVAASLPLALAGCMGAAAPPPVMGAPPPPMMGAVAPMDENVTMGAPPPVSSAASSASPVEPIQGTVPAPR
jgi:hypothetical protein